MDAKIKVLKPKHHRRIGLNWDKRMEEREKRISEREARRDQQFEKLFATIGSLAASLNAKPEPPQFVKVPDYNCYVIMDGVQVAEMIRVPALQPALDLLTGLVFKHVGAHEFSLVLTRAEE